MATCAICDNIAQFRCGKCRMERYCSRECQRDHWPHHKLRCTQLAAEFAAAAAANSGTSRGPGNEAGGSGSSATVTPRPPHAPSTPQPAPPAAFRGPTSRGANPRVARLLADMPPVLQPAAPVAASLPSHDEPAAPHLGCEAGGDGASDSLRGSGDAVSGIAGGRAAAGPTGSGSGSNPEQLRPRPPLAPRPPSALPPPGAAGPGRLRPKRPHLCEGPLPAPGVASALLGGGSEGGGSILDRFAPPPLGLPASGQQPQQQQQQQESRRQQQESQHQQQQEPVGAAPAEPSDAQSGPCSPPRSPPTRSHSSDSEPQAPSTPDGTQSGCAMMPCPGSGPPAARLQLAAAAPAPWPWAGALFPSTSDGASAAARPAARAAACFSDLPPELLLEVLKALPARSLAAAASVCRSWRRAAREPWLWVRQLCVAGYPLPAAAYIATSPPLAPPPLGAVSDGGPGGGSSDADAGDGGPEGGARAVAGVRGIRAVRAVRAAGGSSHEDFLGGLRAGFLDRLQQQVAAGTAAAAGGPAASAARPPQAIAHQGHTGGHSTTRHHPLPQQQHQQHHPYAHLQPGGADLKALYGRVLRAESNWRCGRYTESVLREHTSNVECLAFQEVAPWGAVLLSAAWDGGVRLFTLGPPGGAPQQARCVRRYRGHTGWVTCMAAGRHQVVTASTDRRVAAWRYYSECGDPWVTLEHPQEVTLVRFAYAPPPPSTTHYLSHHLCAPANASPPSPDSAQTSTGADDDVGHGCNSSEVLAAQLPYDPQYEDWVITGCVDGALRLWHLPSKQLLRLFSGHADVVWGAHVLHGGSVLVSAGRDGAAKLWQLPPHAEVDAAVVAAGARRGGPAVTSDAETVEPMASLCGHTSAILCMDVYRAPAGIVPPAPPLQAATSAGMAGVSLSGTGFGASGGGRPDEALAAHTNMLANLQRLLSTDLLASSASPHAVHSGAPGAAADGRGGGSPAAAPTGTHHAGSSSAAATGAHPVWLVATGGADAVVRVWDLSSARCLATLRGHTVGVLSLRFGHLPRHPGGHRDGLLLPPDLDVSAAAPSPSLPGLALPPGQYGAGYAGREPYAAPGVGGHVLPPSQRLVLVSGSVRDVRVWDPLSGAALAVLSDHSGPVTALALVHGALVTLAMNDGLIIYKCNGLDATPLEGGGSASSGGGEAAGEERGGATALPAPARLRRTVAAQRYPLEPVICMQGAPHHSFAAALAAGLEGLAVGSGSGDITVLDFRSRASSLPPPLRSQQPPPQQQQQAARHAGASPFLLRF